MWQVEALERMNATIARDLPRGRRVEVLEAGGGSITHVRLETERRVTALDISDEQLARNAYVNAHRNGTPDVH